MAKKVKKIKLKTHRGAAKRFKRTKNGKFLRGKAFKQHILSSKSTKRKRGLRGTTTVAAVAEQAFGKDVVEHYVHAADIELAAFGAAVTDWERVRGFERL